MKNGAVGSVDARAGTRGSERDGDRENVLVERRTSEENEPPVNETSIVTSVEAQMDALERELGELDEQLARDGARAMAVARDLEVERCLGRRLREELCEANARIAGAKRDLAKREREIADLLAAENIVVPHSIEGAIEIEEETEEGVQETAPSLVETDAFALRRAELDAALARERERSTSVRSTIRTYDNRVRAELIRARRPP
tara:strand:- start:328 stop:936 length:609 start_codon:yes stop_codon:yes gene_type:complete